MVHIANNFISSSVHASLIVAISREVDQQKVIVPIRDRSHKGMNEGGCPGVTFKYILFNNNLIRYFPLLKVIFLSLKGYFVFRSFNESQDREPEVLDVVAHNFWSDGMLAFFNSFFVPMRYMLVVRNTDINYFVAKLPHYRWLMRWAIRRSEGLVFVSKSHFQRFEARWPGLLRCARKVEIVPNAISDWWLSNVIDKPLSREKQACFVGRFDKNKNLVNLLKASRIVHQAMPDFKLVLAGGERSDFLSVTGLSAVPEYVEIVGKLAGEDLLKIYRSSRLFAMPSFTETFGLVYLEALSQGCSVICSSGEGIDGMWDEPFIRSVDPKSVSDLAKTMIDLVDGYPEGIPARWSSAEIGRFGWERVAKKYLEFFA